METKKLLDNVVFESKKKGLTTPVRRQDMVVSKRDNSRCEWRNVDVNIGQLKTFYYPGSVVTAAGKCDT